MKQLTVKDAILELQKYDENLELYVATRAEGRMPFKNVVPIDYDDGSRHIMIDYCQPGEVN